MSIPLFPFALVIMILLAGVYATYSKRNKLFCDYEGEDGTYEYRWIKDNSGYVIFRGRKHKIMPERMSTVWVRAGIHWLFPTRAMHLSFVWYSEFPRDPKNFSRTIVDPKVRKVIDKSELLLSYFRTSTSAAAKKEGFFSRYGLIIVVVIVIIMGFWMYQNMQTLAAGMNHMQQQINMLLPK